MSLTHSYNSIEALQTAFTEPIGQYITPGFEVTQETLPDSFLKLWRFFDDQGTPVEIALEMRKRGPVYTTYVGHGEKRRAV
jgi:hypothetical protein